MDTSMISACRRFHCLSTTAFRQFMKKCKKYATVKDVKIVEHREIVEIVEVVKVVKDVKGVKVREGLYMKSANADFITG